MEKFEDSPEKYRVFNQVFKEFYNLSDIEEVDNKSKKISKGTIHIEPKIIQ